MKIPKRAHQSYQRNGDPRPQGCGQEVQTRRNASHGGGCLGVEEFQRRYAGKDLTGPDEQKLGYLQEQVELIIKNVTSSHLQMGPDYSFSR